MEGAECGWGFFIRNLEVSLGPVLFSGAGSGAGAHVYAFCCVGVSALMLAFCWCWCWCFGVGALGLVFWCFDIDNLARVLVLMVVLCVMLVVSCWYCVLVFWC